MRGTSRGRCDTSGSRHDQSEDQQDHEGKSSRRSRLCTLRRGASPARAPDGPSAPDRRVRDVRDRAVSTGDDEARTVTTPIGQVRHREGDLGHAGGVSSKEQGDRLDAARVRVLRSMPPVEALASATDATGGVVEGCEVLLRRGLLGHACRDGPPRRWPTRGGRSSPLCPAGRAARSGRHRHVTAAALELAEQLKVPTPHLIGCDPTGEQSDVPSVLMSRLDGRPVWEPRHRRSWCEQLAETMGMVHDMPVLADTLIAVYEPYSQTSYAPPAWARSPAVWEHADRGLPRPSTEGAQPVPVTATSIRATCCGSGAA